MGLGEHEEWVYEDDVDFQLWEASDYGRPQETRRGLSTSACDDGRHDLCGNPECTCACHDDITPEACVICGNYFNYKGGRQCCPICIQL